jgi:hypothetical protein
MKPILALVAVLVLAGCSQSSGPPNRTTELTVVEVFPVSIVNSIDNLRELGVRVRVRNTSDRTIWIIGGTDWAMSTSAGRHITSAFKSGQLNSSNCTRDTVPPGGGVTCNLFFYFGAATHTSDIFPASVRYSEPYGGTSGRVVIDGYVEQ